jgi:type I restriction enzyme S subunit
VTDPAERTTKPVPSIPDVTFASLPITMLAKGDRRLESETYLTGGYAIRRQIETSGIAHSPMIQLAKIWQPSRLKGITVAQEHGVPFFTATQVFDIRPSARKWLALDRIESPESLYIKRGWILVTRSGNVGETIIAYSPHQNALISDDLLRVQVREDSYRGYLYTFIRSRFGCSMLRSNQYGSIIKHLEPEHLFDIPVPLVNEDILRETNSRIEKVFQLRDEAFALTQSAESRYANEIGVVLQDPGEETGYTVNAMEVFHRTRRIDGYHYNPKAKVLLQALQSIGKPIQPLSSLVEQIILPNRFKRGVPSRQGIPYLDSEDIFKVNPEITKFIPEVTKKDADSYYVQAGWILLARSGQIYGINGSTMLATKWHERKIISEHIIRIAPNPHEICSGYLQMALGHPTFGRPLVLRLAFGTEVPEIAPDDLKDFPVIRLKPSAEDEVAQCVERASHLRMQADEEENAAVQFVEKQIGRMLENRIEIRGTQK